MSSSRSAPRPSDLASAWERRAAKTQQQLLKKRREEQRKRQAERIAKEKQSGIYQKEQENKMRQRTDEQQVVEEENDYSKSSYFKDATDSITNNFKTPSPTTKIPSNTNHEINNIKAEKERAQPLLQQFANAATPSTDFYDANNDRAQTHIKLKDKEIILSPSMIKRAEERQQRRNKREPLASLLSPLFSNVPLEEGNSNADEYKESGTLSNKWVAETKHDQIQQQQEELGTTGDDLTARWVKNQQKQHHQQQQNKKEIDEKASTSSSGNKVSNFLKMLDETEASDKKTMTSTLSNISPTNSTFLSNQHDSDVKNSSTASLLNTSRAVVQSIMGDNNNRDFNEEERDDEWDRQSSISAYAPSIAPSNHTYASTVRARVTGLAMEVEDKTRTVVLMKKKLQASRIQASEREEQLSKERALKIKQVRGEYEETIQRHLSFIDRLLADKQALSEKCDLLTQELKRMEKMFNESVSEMKRRHDLEMSKARDVWHASEKIKRENWMQIKTKEIKSTTIKGLEPEVQRILSKHKKEIRRMEEKHLQYQAKIKQELIEKHEESIRRLRDKMEEEREDIVTNEQSNWREKFRALTKKCENRVEDIRMKMEERDERQRHRFEEEREHQNQQYNLAMKRMQDQHLQKINDIEQRHQRVLDEIHTKQDARLTIESARMVESRKEWQQIQLEKMKLQNKEKEKEFRDQLRRERDRQIDEIIEKLDEENTKSQMNIKEEYEKRIRSLEDRFKRSQDDHTKMLSEERQRSERILKQSQNTKEEINNYEDVIQTLQEQLGKSKTQNAKYEKEIDDKEMHLRREYAEKRDEDLRTIDSLKGKLIRLEERESEHDSEMTRKINLERKKNEEELDSLHERVKETISRKDSMIAMLKEQVMEGEMRAKTAEMLLEKQRVELLG
jgi:hypothetical protein